MPIRPSERARYPADWPAISLAIRERASWRCECLGECGHVHDGRCDARQAHPHPVTGSTVVRGGHAVTIDRTSCTARVHSTMSAYSYHGCRCADAREEWRTYSYNRRHGLHQPRRVDAQPTITRLRILAGLGYDFRTLARHYGCTPRHITDLTYGRSPIVFPATATRVADLFNRLAAAPQPHGYPASRAIDNTRRAGWGVVDMHVVDQALAGSRPALTPLEKAAVLYIGVARGLPPTHIATAARANARAVHAIIAA